MSLIGRGPAISAERVALVIGNGDYPENSLFPRLSMARADAELIARTLTGLGFQVIPAINANRSTMYQRLLDFEKAIARGGTAFFYFAGHGFNFDGTNYLTGTNALHRDRDLLGEETLSADTVIKKILRSNPKTAIVVLDCCREAPSDSWIRSATRSAKPIGLAAIPARPGLLIGFSADKGALANDWLGGENGPYAKALCQRMESGDELNRVFKLTGGHVNQLSREWKVKKPELQVVIQEPVTYGKIYHDFYFVPAESPPRVAQARAATVERPYVNSLGLEFIPLPGKPGVLMARTETRVRDFRAYAADAGYRQTGGAKVFEVKEKPDGGLTAAWKLDANASWDKPGFSQTGDHPVVCVNWEEARAFCQWLSGREEGLTYRLPTDEEWSRALGSIGKYPWGNTWPPQGVVGNYWDQTIIRTLPGSGWPEIRPGYDDGAERTAGVASYETNRFGFFDLGGNVWEWCQDWYRDSMNDADTVKYLKDLGVDDGGGQKYRVLRGGSWFNNSGVILRSSSRGNGTPSSRLGISGFRCVLEFGGGG